MKIIPHIDFFYHITGRPAAEMLCQGTACFAARHLNPGRWRDASSQDARVYHIGRCYNGPSSGMEDTRPRVEVHSQEAIVLANIAKGGARTLDAYRFKTVILPDLRHGIWPSERQLNLCTN